MRYILLAILLLAIGLSPAAARDARMANLVQMPISGSGPPPVSCSGAALTAYNNMVTNLSGSLDTAHANAYKALICDATTGLYTTGEIDGTLAATGSTTATNCNASPTTPAAGHLDILYVLGTDTTAHALTNLCGGTAFNAVAENSPTFVADHGYTGVAGSSGGSVVDLNTGYNPGLPAGAVNLVQNSASIMAMSLTNLAASADNPAGVGVTGFSLTINPLYTDGNNYCNVNDAGGEAGQAYAGSLQALFDCNRDGLTTAQSNICTASGCVKNHDTGQTATGRPNGIFRILAQTAGSGASGGWGGQIAAAAAGGSMTLTNLTHIHTALCAFQAQLSVSWPGC